MSKIRLFTESQVISFLRGKEEDFRSAMFKLSEDELFAQDSEDRITKLMEFHKIKPIKAHFPNAKIKVIDSGNEEISHIDYHIPVEGNLQLFSLGKGIMTTRDADVVNIDFGTMIYSVSVAGRTSEEVTGEFKAFEERFTDMLKYQGEELKKHAASLLQIAQELKQARRKHFYERRQFINGLGFKEINDSES